jgi:hypothetical protein
MAVAEQDIFTGITTHTSPPIMITSKEDYDRSALKFERQADLKLRNSDTIILGGYGCLIKVRYDALVVEYQRSHTDNKILRLDRGIHKIKQIIACGHGGYITFDALGWCKEQGITISLMNWKGEILQVLTPRQSRNARLCHLQFQANESDLGLAISVELIRQKTMAQIVTLEKLGRGTVDFRGSAASESLSGLRLGPPGHEQEWQSPVVQHGRLRQPCQDASAIRTQACQGEGAEELNASNEELQKRHRLLLPGIR